MADNVIKAVFASGRRVKTAPLWRYDHGIRLLPIGLELPEHYEMHFSNSKTGEAKTQLADSTGAVIPAEYLIPGTEVYAWIYLVGDSYGRTKAEIIIPVDPKAQSTDQEPTPEQQPVIEQAIDALNDAQDALEEAASHIIESGITPEERGKLAGIEAGAEVNVIEEVRAFDLLRGYVPLPVTNKVVDLPAIPEVQNYNDVVYIDFEVNLSDMSVSCDLTPEETIAGAKNRGQTIIARMHFSDNPNTVYFLPLADYKTGSGFFVVFAGFWDAGNKIEIRGTTNFPLWTAAEVPLVDWDSADNTYLQINQGSENSGKVLTVGADGTVTPQYAAGGAVLSVNGETGNVLLDASDVGAYEKPATGIPASDLASGVIPANMVLYDDSGSGPSAAETIPLVDTNGVTWYLGVDTSGVPFVGDTNNQVVWVPTQSSYASGDEVSY